MNNEILHYLCKDYQILNTVDAKEKVELSKTNNRC